MRIGFGFIIVLLLLYFAFRSEIGHFFGNIFKNTKLVVNFYIVANCLILLLSAIAVVAMYLEGITIEISLRDKNFVNIIKAFISCVGAINGLYYFYKN